jgi:hypothetical protein
LRVKLRVFDTLPHFSRTRIAGRQHPEQDIDHAVPEMQLAEPGLEHTLLQLSGGLARQARNCQAGCRHTQDSSLPPTTGFTLSQHLVALGRHRDRWHVHGGGDHRADQRGLVHL